MRFQCKVAGHCEALWQLLFANRRVLGHLAFVFFRKCNELCFGIAIYFCISGNCTRFWAWPAELFIFACAWLKIIPISRHRKGQVPKPISRHFEVGSTNWPGQKLPTNK